MDPSSRGGDLFALPSPAVTFPEDLHCTKVTIISEEQCRRVYPGSVTANMVCAGESRSRADSCQVGAGSGPSRNPPGPTREGFAGGGGGRGCRTRTTWCNRGHGVRWGHSRGGGGRGGEHLLGGVFMGGDAPKRPRIWGGGVPSPPSISPPPSPPPSYLIRVTPGDPSCVTGGSRASSPGVRGSVGTPRNPASTSTSADTPGGSRKP